MAEPDATATPGSAAVQAVPAPALPAPAPAVARGAIPGGAAGVGALAGVVIGVAAVAALSIGREVLIPITLAVLLSFVLSPLVALLRRLRFGRVGAALIAMLLALGIIVAGSAVIGTQIAALVARAPLYQTTISGKVGALQRLLGEVLPARISAVVTRIESLGTPEGPVAPLPAAAQGRAAALASGGPAPVPVIITRSETNSALAIGQRILTPVLGPLASLGIVLLVAAFILLQKDDLRDRMIRLLAAGDLFRATAAMDEAGKRLSRYFLAQLGVNCTFGVIIGAGLFVIGVPSPLLWGSMAALLRFVPYVGSYIAAVLPVLLAAAVGHGWTMAFWTAGLFIATEVVIANVVEPMLYSRSTGLSPLGVVVAAIFWTWLWGPIGLVLSTPITLCLVVLSRHVEPLGFLDVLLGEGPALTPMESFYQRLLAGDPDEAADSAERFLEHHSLAEYYDQVMREGLRIASRDAGRGVLTQEQTLRIRQAAMDLVHVCGAAGTPPTAPGVAASAGAVLCVAGRGAFDDVAAAMFAVLLARRGIEARVVPNDAISRARIAALDAHGMVMAAVLSFDFAGNPTHLRLLVRRLRERFGDVSVLLGLWPPGDPFLGDGGAQEALGAAWCVGTFGEAREAALAAVRETAAEPTGQDVGSGEAVQLV
ncbi:MAG: AI-2E family transporter [Rhodospirillales bacterium]|nr:AI-2E family transporter [Rhodospirillales bacterium]